MVTNRITSNEITFPKRRIMRKKLSIPKMNMDNRVDAIASNAAERTRSISKGINILIRKRRFRSNPSGVSKKYLMKPLSRPKQTNPMIRVEEALKVLINP
jgi:hypothetical protein